MTQSARKTAIPNNWDDKAAKGLSEEQLLLYRSNLLGSDLRVTNYGGGNTSAKVMMDRETGRSKGFGFVEMGSDAEAQAAINGMNGQPLSGRSVVVNEGEGQLRFPVYLGPAGRFHEVRLVSYKGKTLLYVMEPGTDRYVEEWILR